MQTSSPFPNNFTSISFFPCSIIHLQHARNSMLQVAAIKLNDIAQRRAIMLPTIVHFFFRLSQTALKTVKMIQQKSFSMILNNLWVCLGRSGARARASVQHRAERSTRVVMQRCMLIERKLKASLFHLPEHSYGLDGILIENTWRARVEKILLIRHHSR